MCRCVFQNMLVIQQETGWKRREAEAGIEAPEMTAPSR